MGRTARTLFLTLAATLTGTAHAQAEVTFADLAPILQARCLLTCSLVHAGPLFYAVRRRPLSPSNRVQVSDGSFAPPRRVAATVRSSTSQSIRLLPGGLWVQIPPD